MNNNKNSPFVILFLLAPLLLKSAFIGKSLDIDFCALSLQQLLV